MPRGLGGPSHDAVFCKKLSSSKAVARKMLVWPKRCTRLARAFLWGKAIDGLTMKLAQLLGQLGVCLTCPDPVVLPATSRAGRVRSRVAEHLERQRDQHLVYPGGRSESFRRRTHRLVFFVWKITIELY